MPISTSERLAEAARTRAAALGFSACRIGPATLPALVGERLDRAIRERHHASMSWMETTRKRRHAPTAMWDEARSAVVVALDYTPRSDPIGTSRKRRHGNVSVYARGRDYHDVIKGRLKTLASQMLADARRIGRQGDVKVFVDTAPLMEKPLAAQAGLGWQGKHTNLVSREHGSWLLLGSVLTTLELAHDAAETDHCGTCRRCLDACPTDAFPAPYRLDARRCISYLTIEHHGPVPHEFRRAMGNRIYGCDDCLAVCPWNKFANEAARNRVAEPEDWRDPPLRDLLALDDAGFRRRFAGSPVKRIGRDRFVRNAAIAAGNSADASLSHALEPLTRDPDATVAEAARWARERLAS